MGRRLEVGRAAVALTTALSFGLSPAAPLLALEPQATKVTPEKKATPAPKAAPGPAVTPAPKGAPAAAPAAPAAVDGGWPRGYTTPSGGKIVVYQPQVASWDQQRQMVAYAAGAYEAKGAPKPATGSLKIEANTKVAVSERLVSFKDMRITESNFPSLPKEQTREVV